MREQRVTWLGSGQAARLGERRGLAGDARSNPQAKTAWKSHRARLDRLSAEMNMLRRRIETLQYQGAHTQVLKEVLIEDLEVANDELKIAAEEARRLQVQLDDATQNHLLASRTHDRLIALLPVALLETDRHGRITTTNAAASVLLGRPAGALRRMPLLGLVERADRRALGDWLRTASRAGTDFRRVVTMRQARTRPVTVELQATVVEDPQARVQGVTCVMLAAHGATANQPITQEGRDSLVRALANLTHMRFSCIHRQEVLDAATRFCSQTLGSYVSVSLFPDEAFEPDLPVGTATAVQVDDWAPVTTDTGPLAEAWRVAHMPSPAGLRSNERWRALAGHLEATNVDGVIALPFGVGDQPRGVFQVDQDIGGKVGTKLAEAVLVLSGAVAAILHEMDVRAELILDEVGQDVHGQAHPRETPAGQGGASDTRHPPAARRPREDKAWDTPDWEGLTEAEARVAAFIAEGLTNRAIAESLVVSPHTVDAHLKHIYVKLGIHSRVELAVLALQHGVDPDGPPVHQ